MKPSIWIVQDYDALREFWTDEDFDVIRKLKKYIEIKTFKSLVDCLNAEGNPTAIIIDVGEISPAGSSWSDFRVLRKVFEKHQSSHYAFFSGFIGAVDREAFENELDGRKCKFFSSETDMMLKFLEDLKLIKGFFYF